MIFQVLPVDRGVIMLVDQTTGYVFPHHVKLRTQRGCEGQEILLSSTIINKVYYSRKCLLINDAFDDSELIKY